MTNSIQEFIKNWKHFPFWLIQPFNSKRLFLLANINLFWIKNLSMYMFLYWKISRQIYLSCDNLETCKMCLRCQSKVVNQNCKYMLETKWTKIFTPKNDIFLRIQSIQSLLQTEILNSTLLQTMSVMMAIQTLGNAFQVGPNKYMGWNILLRRNETVSFIQMITRFLENFYSKN